MNADGMPEGPPTTLLEAFGRVRVAAEHHMDEMDGLGLGWTEEAVTEVAIHKGSPFVKVIPFNKPQEGVVGADWLWWWLDSESDECFGMLVQAKRLRHQGESWTLDIRQRGGEQLRDLLAAAKQLQVPAIYAVYTGGHIFREDLPCMHGGNPDCHACERMAITLTSAYQMLAVRTPRDTATMLLNEGLGLEDLVDPDQPAGTVHDLNLNQLGVGALRDFLVEAQRGPREIAKRIFKAVSEHRMGAFSLATADPLTLGGPKIFHDVPMDRGHFPGPYFEHFLGGLRTARPAYVMNVLLDLDPAIPEEFPASVAGVVIVAT